MSFRKSIFFVLVILSLLFGGLFLRNSFAGWITDLTPPVTGYTITGAGCAPDALPNTTRCGITGTATVTLTCTDTSGCPASGRTAYVIRTLGDTTYPAQPVPPAGPNWTVANSFNQAVSGGSKTIWAYSIDNAGNMESPPVRRDIIFGYTISGVVFNDTDHDGIRDAGETGYNSGATQIISLSGGTAKPPLATPADGSFKFENLAPANYTVTIAIPSGYKATTYTANCSPPACAGSGATTFRSVPITTADSTDTLFGLAPAYSISGTIYNDVDNSGTINPPTDTAFTASAVRVTLSNGQYADSNIANGTFTISNVFNGSYTATAATPVGYKTVLPASRSPVVSGANVTGVTFLIVGYFINGSVIIDYNHNGFQDPGDIGYNSSGTPIVTLSGPASRTASTNVSGLFLAPSGLYAFLDLAAGTYAVTLSVPAGYQIVNSNPASRTIGPDTTVTFFITPSYSIAGNIFIDTDKNTLKNGSEVNYTGAATIQIRTGSCSGSLVTSVSAVNGAYTTGQTLLSGNYVVCYTNKPASYVLTYPTNGTPPFFPISGSITVGVSPACSPDNSNSATCASGNLSNLNFGISNSNSWWQSKGSDFRDDQAKIVNPVPNPGDAACGGPYASIVGPGGTPGVIFSGGYTPDFSPGSASSNNWMAGGLYPENFAPAKSAMRTSYAYYKEYARQNGITPTTLSLTQCPAGLNNCTLIAGLANGIYQTPASTNLTLNAYTFTGNKDYIFLVDGNLTLNGNIWVDNGSTATFIVSGDISVNRNIGVAFNQDCIPATHVGCNIEGFYSADDNFIIQGYGAAGCATPPQDQRLNISGVVVVNAARAGGTFQNNRDLCGNNPRCPAVRIEERPDFLVNAPEFLKHPNFVWREVAP